MRTAIASSVIGVILFFGVSGVDAAPFEYYEAVVRDRVVTNQVTAVDQTVGEIFDATRTNPVPTQQGATDVSGIEIAMGCDSLVVGVGVTNVRQSNEAAPKLGLATQAFEVSLLGQLDQAFDAMLKAGMQAVVVNAESLFYQGKARIARLAIARRLPTCVWVRELVEDGALVSYGVDQRAIARRVAVYVDRILKGEKPADMPVEQPTTFELIINMKTAKALGLRIPHSLLLRADQVIE